MVCAVMSHLGLGLGMLCHLHHLGLGQVLLGNGSSLMLAPERLALTRNLRLRLPLEPASKGDVLMSQPSA